MDSLSKMDKEDLELDKLLAKGNSGLTKGEANTDEARSEEDNTHEESGDKEDWKSRYDEMKHKYDVLSGKQYHEVPRLHAENKTLKERIKALEEEAALPKPENKEATEAAFKDLEGEIGVQAVESIKKLIGSNGDKDLLRQVLNKVSVLEKETTRVKRDSFEDKLTSLVPDWAKINKETSWLDWLSNRVPGSRMTYQDALDDAAASEDTKVVAEIFNTYKKSLNSKSSKTPNPEDLLEPGTIKTSYAENAGNKKVYTRNEVDKIYKKIERGVYSDKEASKLEAEIDNAYTEGRITEA